MKVNFHKTCLNLTAVHCSRVLIIFVCASNVLISKHCYNQEKWCFSLAQTFLLLYLLFDLNIRINDASWYGVYSRAAFINISTLKRAVYSRAAFNGVNTVYRDWNSSLRHARVKHGVKAVVKNKTLSPRDNTTNKFSLNKINTIYLLESTRNGKVQHLFFLLLKTKVANFQGKISGVVVGRLYSTVVNGI